jgi:acyl carrier protein
MERTAVTRERIEQFVADKLADLGAERSSISPDALFDDLGMDSLDVTDIGTSVKRELGIEVNPRDFEDVRQVKDALAVVYEKAGL